NLSPNAVRDYHWGGDGFYSDVAWRKQSRARAGRDFFRDDDCSQRIRWSLPANRWIAPSRAVLQPARRQFLSQRHHDAGSARFGSTELYYHNGGPTFSTGQQIFLIVVALFLYAIFLVIQTMRHSGYFMESEHAGVAAGQAHHSLHVQSTAFHAPMLLLYLVVVILLAEKFAIPLDNSMEKFGLPQEFGGAMIAALVLTPEGIGAIQATLRN